MTRATLNQLDRLLPSFDGYDDWEPASFAGGNHQSLGLPWQSDNYAVAKTRAYRYILNHPSGVPLSRLCKALFPKETPSEEDKPISERTYHDLHYHRIRRWLESSEYFHVSRSQSLISVQPRLDAFHLANGKQISNHSDEAPETSGAENATANISQLGLDHKEFARSFLRKLDSISTANQARAVAKPYLKYLESIDEKQLIMEDSMAPEENYLLMPYHTRFNNDARAADQWRRYHNAWERAADGYELGLHLTLTTDPKNYDSILGMTDGIFTAWSDLLEALNGRSSRDERLDFIRALEFTKDGKPHLHVVVFGLGYLDHGWLSNYWGSVAGDDGHAENVWVERLTKRGDEFVHHSTAEDDAETVSAKAYLGEYLSKTFDEIGRSVTQQFDTVDDLDGAVVGKENGTPVHDFERCSIWKMALYWATGRQFWDSSHGLKESTPDTLQEVSGLGAQKLDQLANHGINTLADVRLATPEELAAIEGIGPSTVERLIDAAGKPSDYDLGRWEFRGAAAYQNIPMKVTRNATTLSPATQQGDPPPQTV
jgi:hypothetical protein